MISVPTDAALEAMLEDYLNQCHAEPAHVAATQNYLKSMSRKALRQSRRRLNGVFIKEIDLWNELYSFSSPTNPQLSGKLIREQLRKRLEKEQNYQCCYCRRPLFNSGHAKQIEHILPKSKCVQHTFNLFNLVICCVDCNLKKRNHIWSIKEADYIDEEDYPVPESFDDLYHPRFHNYNEHIKFIRLQSNNHNISIYKGLTVQGKNLCANILTHLSQKEVFVNGNPDLKEYITTIDQHTPGSDTKADEALRVFQAAFSRATEELLYDL
ncbi:CRISPR-associated endonuclease Cas9 [compost metagenome]